MRLAVTGIARKSSSSRLQNYIGFPPAAANRLGAAFLIISMIVLGACGGGSKKASTIPDHINTSVSNLSLNIGSVATVSANVVNAAGTVLTNQPPFTYTSSNTAVATVSTSGAVCAGKWDTNFIVCGTTGVQPGTATLTITSGSLSVTIPIFVHLHVDRVAISPTVVNCLSSSQTLQLTGQAFNNGVDITSTVGPFTWATEAIDVATVDTNGLVTAKTPGQTGIAASIAAVNSVPISWVTCPVQTINIHLASGPATTFALATTGNTVSLTADVLDSHGVSVSVPLNWSSTQPQVASVNSSALVTAAAPGTTTISASCAATCNIGLGSVYSNAMVGAVGGSSATTIYATGTATTSLIPIDSGTNAAAAPITLPTAPNSFLFNRPGSTGYLGSSAGLIVLDANTNTVTQNTGVVGTVLAVSPDSNRVIVAGSNTVWVVGVGSGITTETSPIASATAADFTPDSRGAYIVAGNTLYFWSLGNFRPIQLAGSATSVRFLPNGAFAYLGGGAAGPAVTARATCDNSLADQITTPAAPNFLAPLPNAATVLAVASPGIDILQVNSTLAGCPPPLSDTLTTVDFGAGAFTPRQLILLPDGSKAYVTSNLGQLLGLTTATSAPFAIPLAGGANAFTGGTTLDGTKLYVGASDTKVHRIDVASNADVQQIGVSFVPDLVAVKPK